MILKSEGATVISVNEIENMARKVEHIAATNMEKENYNQVIVLLVELNTAMKSSKKQGGWV